MEWMNLPKEPAIVARQVVWVKMRSHPWWPAQVIETRRVVIWVLMATPKYPPPRFFAVLVVRGGGRGRGVGFGDVGVGHDIVGVGGG